MLRRAPAARGLASASAGQSRRSFARRKTQPEHPVMISTSTIAVCSLLAVVSCVPPPSRSDSFGGPGPWRSVVASAGSLDEPARVTLPPKLLRGEDLFGLSIADAAGDRVGRLDDFLVEASTGELVGVVVNEARGGDAPALRIFERAFLVFGADESGAPRVSFDCALTELNAGDDYSALFYGHEPSQISGEVEGIQDLHFAGTNTLIVKLHDQENLWHRVLIEPAYLALGPDLPLKVGDTLSVSGVMTRDETGKLFVAKSLEIGDRILNLRDAQGVVLWDELRSRFRSARELSEQTIVSADGSRLALSDVLVDWEGAVIAHVVVQIDAVEYALPWDAVDRSSVDWNVPFDGDGLPDLPRVSDDGQVTERL
jgi:sporulation protein YlmC with PRC-barrel domain